MELIPIMMIDLDFSREDILNIENLICRYPEVGLKTLQYSWISMEREKVFIYTP
jgi:hypothetical protein